MALVKLPPEDKAPSTVDVLNLLDGFSYALADTRSSDFRTYELVMRNKDGDVVLIVRPNEPIQIEEKCLEDND